MNPATLTRLNRSDSLRLVGPHRVVARCGTLWVTRDGESDDLILEPGASVALDGRRPALVTALGDAARAEVESLAPGRRAPWRDWLQRRAPSLAGTLA